MAEQPSGFRWAPATNRYHDTATGRFVPAATVRAQVDTVVGDSAAHMRGLTEQLQAGKLTVAQWQTAMAASVKESHLSAAVAAKGGWAQMNQSDFGFVGSRIKDHYQKLGAFAEQIANGTQKLDGTALSRAELYGNAGRSTNREMERRMGRLSGDDEERRVLGPADHCPDCLDAAAQGWQPVGTLPQIGDSACGANCRCYFDMRTSTEAAMSEAA